MDSPHTHAAPLNVEQVLKRYGSHLVLDAVSLALRPGEIFGLIGLNGVGKTTLIKIILGLSDADSGTVMLAGKPSASVEARRGLSYLPEKFQPSRYLVGMEYLDLSLSYYGKKLDRERARQMAVHLDLDPDALDRRVSTYSKGMGQKLGLVGAFLVDCPLLVLDEPMSGLDPSARIRLKMQLEQAKREGRTVFFSSHILSDIDEICDRIGVIHDTHIFFTGTPSEFRARYGKDETLEKAFLNSIQKAAIA